MPSVTDASRAMRRSMAMEPSSAPRLLPGTMIAGRYRILDVLGEGGMGTVYRAEQPALHRRVALKVVRPELSADASMIARFEREAYASSRITSPHVVVVHDFGRAESGLLYLVMERSRSPSPGDHAPGYRPDRFEVSVIAGSHERRSAILERLPSRPATLVVHAPDGAEVRVDGLLAGRGEVESELVPGEHHVVVTRDGESILERDVTLGEGDRLVLDAVVRDGSGSIAEEPWLWIVVGLAVVGAGVGIGVGVYLSQPPVDPINGYAGTTGVSITALRF